MVEVREQRRRTGGTWACTGFATGSRYQSKSGSLHTHAPYQPPDDDDGLNVPSHPSLCCLALPGCPMSHVPNPCRPCQSVPRLLSSFSERVPFSPRSPCLLHASACHLVYCSFLTFGFWRALCTRTVAAVLIASPVLSAVDCLLLLSLFPLSSLLTRSHLPHAHARSMPGHRRVKYVPAHSYSHLTIHVPRCHIPHLPSHSRSYSTPHTRSRLFFPSLTSHFPRLPLSCPLPAILQAIGALHPWQIPPPSLPKADWSHHLHGQRKTYLT